MRKWLGALVVGLEEKLARWPKTINGNSLGS